MGNFGQIPNNIEIGPGQSIRRNAANNGFEAFDPIDDIVEVANYASLPVTGETGKIYITLDTNYQYRWSGSVYVEIKDSGETARSLGVLYNGATPKTTIADSDMLGLMDSEAANIFKKISWADTKTVLTTYFNGLYNKYSLPTASTTILGGVKVDGTTITINGSGVISSSGGAGLSWGASITGTSLTGLLTTIGNSASAGTIGQSIVIGNTQTQALTGLSINTGTSAIAHTRLNITLANASTTSNGINISLTGTGRGINFSSTGGTGNVGINFATSISTSNGARYGIYQSTIGSGTSNNGNGYGIYQSTINNIATGSGLNYGIYQGTIGQSNGGTGYGIYQNIIGNANANAIGWYVANVNFGKYFSLNGRFSGTLTGRTTDMSDNIQSRTHTGATSITDNFNQIYLKRTSIVNNAGGTFINTGSVLSLENLATQTAGTLTDTVAVLKLTQSSSTSNGGHILFNAYTPGAEANVPNNTLWYNGTDFKFKDNTGTVRTINKT